MEPPTSADAQTKCTLRVSRSKTFDVDTLEWESNTIKTEEGQISVRYEGKPLESRTRYYWCIRVLDPGDGTSTIHTSAEQSWFETGFFSPSDWTAQWISPVIIQGRSDNKPIYLRGQVEIPSQPLQGVHFRHAHDEWLGLCQTHPPREGLRSEAGTTEILPSPTTKLVSEEVERVQELFRIRCQSITRSPKGCQIIDFGQNLVGIVDIRLRGKAGSAVTLPYSEIIGKDGEVNLTYVAPWVMPDKPQQDIVHLSDEEVNYKPWFGIYGFRCVEVKGLDESLTTSDVQGIVLGTAFAQPAHTDLMDPSQC
ncbi:family 78 glycoside hydrolase domain-containing protein [Microdochium nivale]|nr:family 78 glycoside hydrolase domain-containing protein [Microdochium nivale]